MCSSKKLTKYALHTHADTRSRAVTAAWTQPGVGVDTELTVALLVLPHATPLRQVSRPITLTQQTLKEQIASAHMFHMLLMTLHEPGRVPVKPVDGSSLTSASSSGCTAGAAWHEFKSACHTGHLNSRADDLQSFAAGCLATAGSIH
jgi:hypothetical protein